MAKNRFLSSIVLGGIGLASAQVAVCTLVSGCSGGFPTEGVRLSNLRPDGGEDAGDASTSDASPSKDAATGDGGEASDASRDAVSDGHVPHLDGSAIDGSIDGSTIDAGSDAGGDSGSDAEADAALDAGSDSSADAAAG